MNPIIHAAPLQGLTDFRFRNLYHQIFGGVDLFYAPYIRLTGKKEIKPANLKDIDPLNNGVMQIIPQVLTNKADDFLLVANTVKNLGYNEINWNLGCPYPMVTKRGMGAGMLLYPDRIEDVLEKVISQTDIQISMKMRLGNENETDIFKILPRLDRFPIKNITIHPRIGKQLYKGTVDIDGFERCLDLTSHIIIYNGDIQSVADYEKIRNRFPQIKNWMLGRGMIANPWLPLMIKENCVTYPENRFELLYQFHDLLLNEYEQKLSGDAHIILKMKSFWEYWIQNFPNNKKLYKKVKKAKSLPEYRAGVGELFSNRI